MADVQEELDPQWVDTPCTCKGNHYGLKFVVENKVYAVCPVRFYLNMQRLLATTRGTGYATRWAATTCPLTKLIRRVDPDADGTLTQDE